MAILPIYLDPQKILREMTEDIDTKEISDKNLQDFILSMAETMANAQGIGLAAPQVGSKRRICIISYDIFARETEKKEFNIKNYRPQNTQNSIVLINPYIIKKSLRKIVLEEGCLSIPGIYGTVKRPREIKVKYIDMDGQEVVLTAGGWLSRVIQHEVDHLNGILFTDKIIKYVSDKPTIPEYPYIK